MRALLLAFTALCLCACQGSEELAPLWGETPVAGLDLRAELTETEVPLLEKIELVLDLYVASGVEVDFAPQLPKGFVGRVRDPLVTEVEGGLWTHYVLELQPVELGSLTIPPFEVSSHLAAVASTTEPPDETGAPSKTEPEGAATDTAVPPASPEYKASTAEFELEVKPDAEAVGTAVEAPHEIYPGPLDFTPWRVGLGVLALLIVGFLWWRRHVPKRVHPKAIPLPAHVKALRELSRLKSAPRIMPDEIDAFYVAVSMVLRSYLEDRFGLHAPDRTSEEFLPEVEQSGVLDRAQQSHLGQFLQQTDLVKFAKHVPDASAHDAALAFAHELVESTREDRVSTPAAASSSSLQEPEEVAS